MNKIFYFIFFFHQLNYSVANYNIVGGWKGAIIGHVDDEDYIIASKITEKSSTAFLITLTIKSKKYKGNFLLDANLNNSNQLYVSNFRVIKEEPFSNPHFADCFTGYFLFKIENEKLVALDLYRNSIVRSTINFIKLDKNGNSIPDFECFTTVLLHRINQDSSINILERTIDSVFAIKINTPKSTEKRIEFIGKTVIVKNKQLKIEIWDNNKEDGDIISLKLNNEWILEKFHLKKQKYFIQFNLIKKENKLTLFAENLGSIPPNTAAITIYDGDIKKTYTLNSDLKKSETIKIILAK
jgi:hypothetical protein